MTTAQYDRLHDLIFSIKDYSTSEKWLRDYLNSYDDNDAVFLLAWTLSLQNNYKEAYDLISHLVNNSIKSFKKAQYLYLLTEIRYFQNRWTDTIYFANITLQMYKEYAPDYYIPIINTIQHLAYSYHMVGDFINSDRQYVRAIKMSEDKKTVSHYLYSEYADLKCNMRHYDTALKYYTKRILHIENDRYLDPALKNSMLSQSKNVSGCICLDKGQTKIAYDFFYDAVSLDPDNYSAILNLAEVYAINNNIERSQYYLSKGLNKLDLKNTNFWKSSLIEGKSYSFYKHNSLFRIILSFFWERGLIDKELYDAHFKSTHMKLNISNTKIKIFISYSHHDELYKDKLYNHLSPLWQNNKIEAWNDRMILPGSHWDDTIKHELRTAHIVLFLISAEFNASDYIWKNEISETIKRSDNGEVIAIPIYTRPCDFIDMPYAKLQGLPKDAKPVSSFTNQDEALSGIAKSIREMVDRLIENK